MNVAKEAVKTHETRVRRLLACCSRVLQAQATSGMVHIIDVDLVFESSLLAALGSFEGCLETLLERFVCGTPSSRPSVHSPLITVRSKSDFRVVLLRGKNYINYAPYSECIKHARHFLRDGRPFTDPSVVSAGDQDTLRELQLTRNAIAHKTDDAMKKFRKNVPAAQSIPSHLRSPGRFLRTTYRSSPRQTHIEHYAGVLMRVPSQLLAAW